LLLEDLKIWTIKHLTAGLNLKKSLPHALGTNKLVVPLGCLQIVLDFVAVL
jgi:hypothetical protein